MFVKSTNGVYVCTMTFRYTSKQWFDRVARCIKFADKEVKTSMGYRKQRGQWNVEKMKQDVAFGKLGEMAVYDYFVQAGQEVTPIDFEIYTGGNKSFDADLYWKGQHVHVKTQSSASAKRYGASWTFQAQSKKGHEDPYRFEGIGVFCIVYPFEKRIDVCGAWKMQEIQHQFKEPKLKHLKHSKRCIYLDDIQDIPQITI